ncbi:MAG TPA: S1/P1 nuclease [Puia sp.]
MTQHTAGGNNLSIPAPIIARFGGPRHRAIADIANDHLEPGPKAKIQVLLKKIKVSSLQDIATWADDIKPTSKKKPKDKDTVDFLAKFHDSREWHFVDLPVNATGYDPVKYAPFTRPDDIVQMTVESINVLLGHSTKFSPLNALRWVTHLVGDMHQPLHIACGYIDFSGAMPRIVFDSDEIVAKHLLQKSDLGGNKIILPIGSGGKPLHTYWDTDLPSKDNNLLDSPPMPAPVPKNQLVGLPAAWVSENVQFAKQAYQGLTVKGTNVHPGNVDVSFDQAVYDKRCVPLIKELSLKAAGRLAGLLNTIFG